MKLKYFLNPANSIYLDAPSPWQIGFQDGASPGYEGIIVLHDSIMFFLIWISVAVFWVLLSLMSYFSSAKSGLLYKYLNHGKIVPIQKCFKFNPKNNYKYIRLYSTCSATSIDETCTEKAPIVNSNSRDIKFYDDAYSMKKLIIKDNKNKSGIYKWKLAGSLPAPII